LLIAVLLTWLIKYPTIVRCEFKLTTQLAPKPVVARTDGRLEKLLIHNNQIVSANQILGFIESSAKHDEVLDLEIELKTINDLVVSKVLYGYDTLKITPRENLGEVQSSYQAFRQQLAQITSLLGNDYYEDKRKLLETDIADLRAMNQYLKGQYLLYERDAALAENEFKLNQKLFKERVIAQLDLDREESKALAKKIPLKNIETSQLTNNAQIRLKQKEVVELDKQVREQKENFLQSINTLRSSIATWKNRYVLISPTHGKITFNSNLQEKDNIKTNTEVFTVFESDTAYVGLLTIPQDNSGKIKMGQRVIIKFQSYPYEEYGMVEGVISSFPQLSTQDNKLFFAFAQLPQGLKTNHNKVLTYNYGMTASGEVVTEDLRLIERIFYSIRKIFN
jgi:HlyD family secretion protein